MATQQTNERYTLVPQENGIGGPQVSIQDTVTARVVTRIYANTENYGQAIVKARAICALMNAGLAPQDAIDRWDNPIVQGVK